MAKVSAEKPAKTKPWRLTKKKSLLLILGLLVLGAYLFIRSLNQPAQGVITTSSSPSATGSPTQSWLVQRGKYVSFDYPSDFSAAPADKPSGVQLEIYKYVKNPWPFWYMSDAVSSLPSGNLSDDASYNLRLVSPAKYKHEKWDIDGSAVDVFSYQGGGYEKTAFIAHSGNLLTVNINSADTESSAKLDTIMKHVLDSVRWVSSGV